MGDSKRINGYEMQTMVGRWGNSHGIRLTKGMMTYLGLKENDSLTVTMCNEMLIIEKACKPKYSSLEERLEDFYKKPLEDIYVENTQEVDTGNPVGGEFW